MIIKIIKAPSGNILCLKLPNLIGFLKYSLKKIIFAGWRLIATIVYSLNLLTSNHTLLTLIMALGLGIGFGWSIFQTPNKILAINFPELRQINYAPANSNITEFEFNTFTVNIATKENKLWNNFSLVPVTYADHQNTRYFKGRTNLYSYLSELNVGDRTQVTYINNTAQEFTLIETKIISKDRIRQFESNDRQQIVIFCPNKMINGEYWVGVFTE